MTTASSAPPTREELLAEFGDEYLSIRSLFRFCFVPSGRLALLQELTLEEDWGANDFVLLKYLAVHLRLAIEQGRYVWNGDQAVLTAGRLMTRTGAPIYVGLVENSSPDDSPWVMNWVGERPSCAELPAPPDLGEWPELSPSAEVVVVCELEDQERRLEIPALEGIPTVAKLDAIAGAVSWSLHRGLAARQIHGGGRGYFVPVWFRSRESLEEAPDHVAPLVVQDGGRVVVRTLLEPHVAWPLARCVVERDEQLPGWLLQSWEDVQKGDGSGGTDGGEDV